jgi:hypothetical protein
MVWAYGVIQLAGTAASFFTYELDTAARAGGILLALAIFVGLLYGARVAWIVAMLLQGIGILGSVPLVADIFEDEGEDVGLNVIRVSLVVLGLIALLHPRTRAWTRPRTPSPDA